MKRTRFGSRPAARAAFSRSFSLRACFSICFSYVDHFFSCCWRRFRACRVGPEQRAMRMRPALHCIDRPSIARTRTVKVNSAENCQHWAPARASVCARRGVQFRTRSRNSFSYSHSHSYSYLLEALGGLRAVEHRHLLVVRRRVLRRAAAERVHAVVRHAVVGRAGERERVGAAHAGDGTPRDAARVRVPENGRHRESALRACGLYGLNGEETATETETENGTETATETAIKTESETRRGRTRVGRDV